MRQFAHLTYFKFHLIINVGGGKYMPDYRKGEVAVRPRDLLRQICMSRDIIIIKGSVARDHVHMLISCSTQLSPAKI